ncbi:bifunctional DNA primase/polymerase [Streptomyces sp. N2-109]|uniref:Bifunctional DNA primase/polymerase n=1 Tax=Streptomyces gossypii TaxID=2883101 RepID=A0ABT2JXN9_9ACTN|nr:bifunctional DNA primase/polymerase [Streptomyces gossypii]MCT2592663.1 bifunctional DNA primase/polymerase [Streptomyces gossypii]
MEETRGNTSPVAAVTPGAPGAPLGTAPPVPAPATIIGQIARPQAGTPLEHAVRYAEDRRWDVFPGTWLTPVGGILRCSCEDAACTAPGAHPAGVRWAGEAAGSATAARRLWSREPRASVLLPTGRTFDALDVPETAGCLATARMARTGRTPGPVISTPDGRMVFFVLPGAAPKLPGLVRKLGWSPARLDLVARGEGDWIAAPPTRLGGRGSMQWALRPTAANRWLPDAEELLPALAYACGHGAARSSGPVPPSPPPSSSPAPAAAAGRAAATAAAGSRSRG